MSATVDSIRQAIADKLASIAGVQCSPWNLGTNFTPPVFQIAGNGPILYDRRGWDKRTFVVQAIVGAVDDIGAQRRLSTFVESTGSSSVKAAIEDDPTLGNVVSDARVSEYLGDRAVTLPNGVEYLIGQWTVEVQAAQ